VEVPVDANIRGWWSKRQGLDGSMAGKSAHDVLVRAGWMRTVGGAGPYLGLFARAGLSREAVDAAIARGEVSELPSARGCTYLVPRDDFAVALAASAGHGDEAAIATAKKHLGVEDAEIDRLCTAILDALAKGPLDPRALKDALGGVVRHLGDAGKKRGTTTTLSLGLGRLQTSGRIRRIPANGRLDQQRFAYARWDDSPARRFDDDTLGAELASRFFRWIGPATVDQLVWWGGMTKKAAKSAAAAVGAVPVGEGPDLVLPADLDAFRSFRASTVPDPRLVGSLDNLAHLRRAVAPLVDVADAARTVVGGGFGPSSTGIAPVSSVLDLPHHAIVDRGRLVGLWDYDFAARRVVARVFPGVADCAAAIERTERFVRDELGDARSFSLDGPESRGERLQALR
jgi:hypothetical protein